MRGDSVYIIYRYRDLGFLDLFTYMSSCSTFLFRRTRTGSYRETASPMLNFPASHSVWQFLETARPTLNLPVRTDGPTTFSTSVLYMCSSTFQILRVHPVLTAVHLKTSVDTLRNPESSLNPFQEHGPQNIGLSLQQSSEGAME